MHMLMAVSTMIPIIFLLSSSVGGLVCSFHLVGQLGPLLRISLEVMPGAAPYNCTILQLYNIMKFFSQNQQMHQNRQNQIFLLSFLRALL